MNDTPPKIMTFKEMTFLESLMTMMTVFSYLFPFSTIQNSHSLDAMKNSHQ